MPRSSSLRQGILLGACLVACAPRLQAGENFFEAPTRTTEPEARRNATLLARFVVEANRLDERPWRYVALPGFEVLTRCDNAQNAYYLSALIREVRVERAMLPEGFLTPLSATNAVILYDSRTPEESTAVPAPATAVADDTAIWGAFAGTHLASSGVAEAADTRIDCLNLWGRDVSATLYTTRCFSTRLLHHSPQYPRWFTEGLIGPAGVYKPGYRFITPDGRTDPEERSIYFPPALWLSPAATKQTRARHLSPVPLLSIAQLLARQPKEAGTALWESEAALFVRWGLFATNAGANHKAAFWALLALAQQHEVTETEFTQCFGFGFDQMDLLLRAYLPNAVTDGVRLRVAAEDPPVPPPTRTATPDQVARIIGDWERISGNEYASLNPDLAKRYFESAEATLLKRFREGGRDPQFLGILGLLRDDLHASAEAIPLLEEAKAGTERPTVPLALARLRFEQALANPGSPNARLSSTQTSEIISLATAARAHPPELAETYSVLARTWLASSLPPTASNLATLDSGAAAFWRDVELAHLIARVRVRWPAAAQ